MVTKLYLHFYSLKSIIIILLIIQDYAGPLKGDFFSKMLKLTIMIDPQIIFSINRLIIWSIKCKEKW